VFHEDYSSERTVQISICIPTAAGQYQLLASSIRSCAYIRQCIVSFLLFLDKDLVNEKFESNLFNLSSSAIKM